MSSMMEPVQQDQMSQSGVSNFAANTPTYRIKRPGARPLAFDGSELAMAMSYTPHLPYWYEVNLYRTTGQQFVAAVRLFYQDAQEQDVTRAWEFDTVEQALDAISDYDASEDIRVSVDPSSKSMSPAELAAHAMDLRSQVSTARRHYQSLVGEFFFELEADQ